LGTTYQELEDYEKAIGAYEKAIAIDPKLFESWLNLGNSYNTLQNYEKAVEAYQKALEIEANDYMIFSMLGTTYLKLKDYEKSKEYAQKVIEMDFNAPDFLIYLGLAYVCQQNYSKAKEIFEGLKEEFVYKESAYYNLACTYSLEGNKEKTLENLKECIDINHRMKISAKKDTAFKWLWEDKDFLDVGDLKCGKKTDADF